MSLSNKWKSREGEWLSLERLLFVTWLITNRPHRLRDELASLGNSIKETDERSNNSAQILPEIERKDKASQFILKGGITLTKTKDITIKLLSISYY